VEKYLMRVAVLLSGEYRKFDVCRESMSFFLDDPCTDIYVSTWNETHYYRPLIDLSYTENVKIEQIKKILNKPAIIEIQSIDEHINLKEKRYNSLMIHRWKRGVELIKNSGVKYDYILITRFDAAFSPLNTQSLRDLFRFKNSLGTGYSHGGGLQDIFFISSYDNIVKLIDRLSIDEWINADQGDWHTWWYEFTVKIIDQISDPGIHYMICRFFSKKGDTFDQIVSDHFEWRDIHLAEMLIADPTINNIWTKEIRDNAINKFNLGYYDKFKNLVSLDQ
jgi:hypothetical protein